jgi:hypothetical protein
VSGSKGCYDPLIIVKQISNLQFSLILDGRKEERIHAGDGIEFSNYGVANKRDGSIIKGSIDSHGVNTVNFTINGRVHSDAMMHRTIYYLFHPNEDKSNYIDHSAKNWPKVNALCNLNDCDQQKNGSNRYIDIRIDEYLRIDELRKIASVIVTYIYIYQ